VLHVEFTEGHQADVSGKCISLTHDLFLPSSTSCTSHRNVVVRPFLRLRDTLQATMRVVLIRATFSACCNRRKAVGRHVTRRFAPVAVLDDIVIVLRPGLDPVCSCSNDVPDVAAFDSVGRLTCRRRERVQSVIEISKESDDESHDSIVTCIVQVPRLRCAETKPLSELLQTF
jgi:hypothetical protein